MNTQLNNRMMTNFKQEQTYEQFNSKQLNDSLKLLAKTEEFVIPREPSLNFSMTELPIQNPTTKPIQNNNSIDFTINNTNTNTNNTLQSFSEFVIPREPALNFGMSDLLIRNPTAKPIQNNNHLDYSTQLNLPDNNKNIRPNNTVISTNDIIEPINKFQGVATPHIPYDEYKKPTAYFDNFNDNGRSDIIREYIVHINSIDRDVLRYPTPFNYLVKCAPLPGDPNASLPRIFSNIRYIKIEIAVLPLKYYLKRIDISNNTIIDSPDYLPINIKNRFSTTLPDNNDIIEENDINWVIIYAKSYTNLTNDKYQTEFNKYNNKKIITYTQQLIDYATIMTVCYECIYDIDTNTYITYKYEITNVSLDNEKYTILYLNDINDISNYSTDKSLAGAFNVLYPDIMECNYLYIDCNYVEKIYKYSNLGNLEKMELRIANSMGKQLTTNLIAQDDKLSNFDFTTCTCTLDLDGNNIRDYKCICSYIRHPRYIRHQNNFMFKIGIIETDMNIRAFN